MSPRVLLLQARVAGDYILEHELECFVERSGLSRDHFTTLNFVTDPAPTSVLREADVVMVGGSGDYSHVKGGHDWLEPMLDLMRAIVDADMPMFGSCFGFQALVKALGGELVTDPKMAELGTFEVSLTEEGERDPLFSKLPERFDAQFGHNDSAIALPETLTLLASSGRCTMQAVRYKDRPIVATQFHPELADTDNIKRMLRYLAAYKDPDESMDAAAAKARAMHRPSPESNSLVRSFIELL